MPNDSSSCFALQAFFGGNTAKAYEYFGVHRCGKQLVFRVYAPHAQAVSVCGDFTDWHTDLLPMQRVLDGDVGTGVWELYIDADRTTSLDRYKYFIRNGCKTLYRADPYGVLCEDAPEMASRLYDLDGYRWRDSGWLSYRKERFVPDRAMRQPINVYALNVGEWRRHSDGRGYSYGELAADLVTYVKQMGYTHVELMPICQQTADENGQCRATGYYATAAGYGEPKALMALVDTMHEAGIGVILDWAPSFFSWDARSLSELDRKSVV